MRAREVIAALFAVLAMVAIGVVYVSRQLDGTLSTHGWIALGLGIGATLLLAAGLLTLMFVSRRGGWDDDAGHM